MLYIHWNSSNETGIEIIDEQHRGIVSVINSYYYKVCAGKPKEALVLTKGILDEMTLLHFRTEEELMERAGFPDLLPHRQMHLRLIAEMRDVFQRSLKENDPHLFLEFLKQWWLSHINAEDKLYVASVRKVL